MLGAASLAMCGIFCRKIGKNAAITSPPIQKTSAKFPFSPPAPRWHRPRPLLRHRHYYAGRAQTIQKVNRHRHLKRVSANRRGKKLKSQPYSNQQLFSDHYLDVFLPQREEWQALTQEAEPVMQR